MNHRALSVYRKPGENEKAVYLTASDIVARFGGQVRLSPVQVGKALQDMGFVSYRSHNGKFWKLFERPASDIGSVMPDDVDIPKEGMPFWGLWRVRCVRLRKIIYIIFA